MLTVANFSELLVDVVVKMISLNQDYMMAYDSKMVDN